MCDFIKEGIRKGNHLSKIDVRDIKKTKKGNGLNIWTRYDEYEIAEELFKMNKNGLFDPAFKMPKFIRKFRDPELS